MKKSIIKNTLILITLVFFLGSCGTPNTSDSDKSASSTVDTSTSDDSTPEADTPDSGTSTTPGTPETPPQTNPSEGEQTGSSEGEEPEEEIYNPQPALDLPLTLKALKNVTINLKFPRSVINLQYSINEQERITANNTSNTLDININKGDTISFYGEGVKSAFTINCSDDCYVYGNVMSLLYSNFSDKTEIPDDCTFDSLFKDNSHIKNSPRKKLELPATKLTKSCYHYMFLNCSSLIEAPELLLLH